MPELPEVEVLVRHLAPLLTGQRIDEVRVQRPRVIRPHAPPKFAQVLHGRLLRASRRRGKYLLFDLDPPSHADEPGTLVGHLGMTGRMFLQPRETPLPRHAAVIIGLGRQVWVFEDPRGFGRLSFDLEPVDRLGPEPLSEDFTPETLAAALKASSQPVKIRLLNQAVVAGIGNIYASEALHRAGIAPRRASRRLRWPEVVRLRSALREVLEEAIAFGSTVPLNFAGTGAADRLFYYGRAAEAAGSFEERLRVYDRADQPCLACGTRIRRTVLAGRSTYHCPSCQR